MVGGADLQLFFAFFEITERHSGCKSCRLNRPEIHLYLQMVTTLVTNQISASSLILNLQSSPLRHEDIGFG